MDPIVLTRQGKLEGDRERRVERFRGIPFAAPPVGALRFRGPLAPAAWIGVREAKALGSAAPQVGPVHPVIRGVIGAIGRSQSQDCLYLNVWTPASDRKRRPVMVWIHGGAFVLGSGGTRMYDGARLARRGDVVVVTINYRLGALGFLDWRSLASSAETPEMNLGIRDQIAALAWVRDNVEAFGGDPENVTVFGESAGAMSAGTLLGIPSARPLFHKAILQSGALHNVSRESKSRRSARYFADALGLDSLSLEVLQSLPVTEIMRAQAAATVGIGLDDGMMAWQPSVDGDLIPEQPLAALERGDARAKPLLIGTNRDEIKLFTFLNRDKLNDQDLVERIERIAERCDYGASDLAERLMKTYGPSVGHRDPGAHERWIALQSDQIFHYPAARLADLQSRYQPNTFAYLFDWKPPLLGDSLGSCHAMEIPFVFGGLPGAGARLRSIGGTDRSAIGLSRYMQDAWLAFARTGQPRPDDPADWPAYDERRRETKALGSKRRILKDPHQGAREFWEPLIADGEARLSERAAEGPDSPERALATPVAG